MFSTIELCCVFCEIYCENKLIEDFVSPLKTPRVFESVGETPSNLIGTPDIVSCATLSYMALLSLVFKAFKTGFSITTPAVTVTDFRDTCFDT